MSGQMLRKVGQTALPSVPLRVSLAGLLQRLFATVCVCVCMCVHELGHVVLLPVHFLRNSSPACHVCASHS